MYAVGWGTTSYGGSSSPDLRNVPLNYYSDSICEDIYSKFNGECQLCSGNFEI